MKSLTLPFVLFVFFLGSCSKDTVTTYDCTGSTPTYSTDVKAIMNVSCAKSGCHSAGSRAAGIDLSTYDKVKAESKNNRFLGTIEHQVGYNPMPQAAAKLDETKQQLLYCWIQNGALQ
ncbi:MAG: hypothetical protein IPL65_14345 [Lewinellaceae bacterium]|nr:hypothetical protein [Lewinellaceae bacterium]